MKDAWTQLDIVLGAGGLKSEPVAWDTVQETAMEVFEAQGNKAMFEESSFFASSGALLGTLGEAAVGLVEEMYTVAFWEV